jgi:hypothetical protein
MQACYDVFLTDKWGNMSAVLNLPRTYTAKVSSNADIADVPCRRSKHNLMPTADAEPYYW